MSDGKTEVMGHMKEPWPERLTLVVQEKDIAQAQRAQECVGVMHGHYITLTNEDYDHARLCVNALAGRDPTKLAELEKSVEAVLEDRIWEQTLRLRMALAAFRS